jgi:hypothetical protein
METAATIAITREATRLAFLCSHRIETPEDLGTVDDIGPGLEIDSNLSFEQERAELLAEIREEVRKSKRARGNGLRTSDLCLCVCRDVLAHLAGTQAIPEHWPANSKLIQ